MQRQHYQVIDIARGCAILMMFIYHISFDLNDVGFIKIDFYNSVFWLNFRAVIVSSFLLLVGISLAIAIRKKLNQGRFIRRLLLLVLYSILVSAASYSMFPRSWIFFGILHFILLASVLGLLFSKLYWLNLVLGLLLLVVGNYVSFSLFDHTYLQWFGLMTNKPVTEDYVPLLPWFGVVLVGMFLGKLLFVNKSLSISKWLTQWSSSNRVLRLLAFGGRYAIHIYILHQPIFIGIIAGIVWLMSLN